MIILPSQPVVSFSVRPIFHLQITEFTIIVINFLNVFLRLKILFNYNSAEKSSCRMEIGKFFVKIEQLRVLQKFKFFKGSYHTMFA